MNELHLFAGVGGGILGGMLLGHTPVCAVEIEPYCRKVLLQRQRDGILPWFPIWDDVRTFDGEPWRHKVDVVCGGFPCSGGHPEWHLQQDVTGLLEQHWDMVIAFPPCTYLTSAGTRHFSRRVNPEYKVLQREKLREKAKDFFMLFVNCKCEKVAVENPVGYMNTVYRKPDQIIHPYYFGDAVQKRTCLWLKGLPLLKPTKLLAKPKPMYLCEGKKCKGKAINWCEGIKGTHGGQKGRAKARSKTFPGIATAMAEQWGGRTEHYGIRLNSV